MTALLSVRWRLFLGLFFEQGTVPGIRRRTKIVWRWPHLEWVYVQYPRTDTTRRVTDDERRAAPTKQDWGKVQGI
jgi:hypothetical protein